MPFDTGAHAAGAGGHFLVLGREDVHDPMGSMAVVYLDDPDNVQGDKITFDYLRSQAADPARSLDLLADARTEILK